LETLFCNRSGTPDDSALRRVLSAQGPGTGWQLIPIAVLGTWALVVNGNIFSRRISLRTRSREIMLPLLLFPFPSGDHRHGSTEPQPSHGRILRALWIALLAAYDVMFTVASLLLFETVLQAE